MMHSPAAGPHLKGLGDWFVHPLQHQQAEVAVPLHIHVEYGNATCTPGGHTDQEASTIEHGPQHGGVSSSVFEPVRGSWSLVRVAGKHGNASRGHCKRII